MAVLEKDERVILVDDEDRPLRDGDKIGTHLEGALHRAFSVFLFRPDGRLVIQRRADCKYHSRGLWANSCCGHPRPGETSQAAAERRLTEEIGIRAALSHGFTTRYRAELEGMMVENEIVHLYFGVSSKPCRLNPQEASASQDVTLEALRDRISARRHDFAAWLLHYFEAHYDSLVSCRDRLLNPSDAL
jgi:isopentenyl-diphosphate Delta-isomerase